MAQHIEISVRQINMLCVLAQNWSYLKLRVGDNNSADQG